MDEIIFILGEGIDLVLWGIILILALINIRKEGRDSSSSNRKEKSPGGGGRKRDEVKEEEITK